MAVKEWFRRLQPAQLYIVLFFTCAFFAVEIVASHFAHSLTLLMNAYHMLCNIVALVGCIASIRYENKNNKSNANSMCSLRSSSNSLNDKIPAIASSKINSKQLRPENRMKNTFGWARIDIVTMLVCCVLLTSFCFSLIVEALQTLVHIEHPIHYVQEVLMIGACGILLNAFCYFLIGGYTFNQGVFLHFTQEGSVILKKANDLQSSQKGDKTEQTRSSPIAMPKTQGLREMCRDVLGCVLIVIVSILIFFIENDSTKYIDPVFAIVSAVSLFVLSYPYMKESGMILLQTIPNHINIDSLQKELLAAFPDILNVHDLHVWQLNGEKVVATIHIVYEDAEVYKRITDQITAFFLEQGISHVTIQSEFSNGKTQTDCLIKCRSKNCSASTCCSREILVSNHDDDDDDDDGNVNANDEARRQKKMTDSSRPIDPQHLNVRIDEINENRDIRIPESTTSTPNGISLANDHHRDEQRGMTIDVDVVKKCAPATQSRETIAEKEATSAINDRVDADDTADTADVSFVKCAPSTRSCESIADNATSSIVYHERVSDTADLSVELANYSDAATAADADNS